ncbi:MAG TPA: uracil-DNA glycosylase, partial [Longimicrobiales bacterium]
PLPDELAACAHFLKAQLTEIRPKVLLAIGKFAAQTLVGSEDSISHLRGRVFRYEGIPLVVSYHPAYLLRNGSAIRTVWEDFQLARKVLDEQA